MAWSDIVAKLKFWGPSDGTPDGPDGMPLEINGVIVSSLAFSKDDKQDILRALKAL